MCTHMKHPAAERPRGTNNHLSGLAKLQGRDGTRFAAALGASRIRVQRG